MITFDDYYSSLNKKLPGFKIAYKNESILMKIISYILFFNKDFMTKYTTTIGKTVYFPSKEYIENDFNDALDIISHEFVHANDSKKIGQIIFSLLYLFPQILAPLMLLLMPINVILSICLFVLFLLPLPAYWRKNYEFHGYQMSLFIYYQLAKVYGYPDDQIKSKLETVVELINTYFTGAGYYFMWPFGVKTKLTDTVNDIMSGAILKTDPLYQEVLDSFNGKN